MVRVIRSPKKKYGQPRRDKQQTEGKSILINQEAVDVVLGVPFSFFFFLRSKTPALFPIFPGASSHVRHPQSGIFIAALAFARELSGFRKLVKIVILPRDACGMRRFQNIDNR